MLEWKNAHAADAPPAALNLAILGYEIVLETKREIEKSLDAASPVASIEAVRGLNERINVLVRHIGLDLDHCTQSSLHPVLSPTVQTQLDRLGIAGQVLVSGTREMSYELCTLEAKHFHSLISEEKLSEIAWPIFIFRVPHPPLDWPLHHVLLFHEIGHALFRNNPLPFEVPDLPELDPRGAANLIERAKRSILLRKFVDAYSSWVEELFADAVGFLVSGPCYLQAFCRVLGGFFTFDQFSHSHPPTAFRVNLLGHALKDRAFVLAGRQGEILNSWPEEARRIHENHKYVAGDDDARKILPLLLRETAKAHQRIVDSVVSVLGQAACTPAMLADDVSSAAIYEKLGVLPVEKDPFPTPGQPGEPRSAERVFSICWLSYVGDVPVGHPQNDKRCLRHGDALLEALDGCEALRTWRESS
jgi:hypothetical protein